MARRGDARSLLDRHVIAVERVRPQLRYTGGPFVRVRFFSLRPEGVEIVGDLFLRDGRIVANPADSLALQNTVNEPLWVDQGEEPPLLLDATLQPEEFLRALLKAAGHGTYFWAEPVED